eukprot:TRINITY_DN4073_c0_g1_i6.p1 TRINITY_DN4073_c0_g1~~TRINITY_DN4073_c0_g1_i6.p1  ORF type:complete len:109 (+),score=11.42 TRINITY_DN4073_c0_g1_i6:126-452(+)
MHEASHHELNETITFDSRQHGDDSNLIMPAALTLAPEIEGWWSGAVPPLSTLAPEMAPLCIPPPMDWSHESPDNDDLNQGISPAAQSISSAASQHCSFADRGSPWSVK